MNPKEKIHSIIESCRDFFTVKIWSRQYKEGKKLTQFFCSVCRVCIISVNGFLSDKCGLHASALTYITLVSLVPILAIMLSFCKGIGMQQKFLDGIGMEKVTKVVMVDGAPYEEVSFRVIGTGPREETESVQEDAALDVPAEAVEATASGENSDEDAADVKERNPASDVSEKNFIQMLPLAMQDAVINILVYVEKTNFAALGLIGCLTLLLTVVMSIRKMEDDFNAIWGVRKGRSLARQFVEYLIVLLLIPVIVLIVLSLKSYITHNELVAMAAGKMGNTTLILSWISSISAFLLAVVAFMLLFIFMPNTKVKLIPALISALVTTIMWSVVQWAYMGMQVGLARYNAIYGTFAIVPFFLALLYANWNVILFGCELGFAIQHHKVVHIQKEKTPLEAGAYYMLGILAMNEICAAFERGTGPWNPEQFSIATAIPLIHLKRVLHRMEDGKLIMRVENDNSASADYVPMRPPTDIALSDLTEIFIGMADGEAREIGKLIPEQYMSFLKENYENQCEKLEKLTFAHTTTCI